MSFNVSTYDPRNVNLYLDGITADNFADGSFISIEYSAAKNNTKSGAKGDITFIKINDGSGSCMFRLKQNSQMNTILWALMNTDDLTPGGLPAGVFSVMQGSALVAGATFKIGKAPKRDFAGTSDGKDEPICEWTLTLANLKILS